MIRSRKRNGWVFWAGLIGCLGLAACAHGPSLPGAEAAPDLARYYPLAVGNSWTYATAFLGQAQADLTVRILSEQDGFFIDDRPAPSRLRFDGTGLRDGSTRYLLKTPLRKGTKWMSVADVKTVEHYEILEVGIEVTVPAGVYRDCVVVGMEVRMTEDRSMLNRMVFAPGVGIIQIQTDLKEKAKVMPQSQLTLKRLELKARS